MQRLVGERYALTGVRMSGGQAYVYPATDIRLETKVAIKCPKLAGTPEGRATLLARLKREQSVLSQVLHPNLVRLLDAGSGVFPHTPEELPYMVMDYLDGESLWATLNRERRLDVDQAVIALSQVLEALGALHDGGVWHRDVKPGNIMNDGMGKYTLLDLGIARLAEAEDLTQTGAAVASLAYAAPEQISADPTLDGRADIFAAGALMHHMLTSRLPFDNQNQVTSYEARKSGLTRASMLVGDPVAARAVAPWDDLILKATAFDPADRYDTAAQMRDDVLRIRNVTCPPSPHLGPDQVSTIVIGPSGSTSTGASKRTAVIDQVFPTLRLADPLTQQIHLAQEIPSAHQAVSTEAWKATRRSTASPSAVFEKVVQVVADDGTRKWVRRGVCFGTLAGAGAAVAFWVVFMMALLGA